MCFRLRTRTMDTIPRRIVRVSFLIVLSSAAAQASPEEGAEISPSSTCETLGADWTATDRKIWRDYICHGLPAQFSLKEGVVLSGKFLEDLLSDSRWKNALPVDGLQIQGVVFSGSVNLNSVYLESDLFLQDCHFKGHVILSQASSESMLSFDGARFSENLNLRDLVIGGSFFLNDIRAEKNIHLQGARVGGSLFFQRMKVERAAVLDRIHVKGDLVFLDVNFGALGLSDARIDGRVKVSNKKFDTRIGRSNFDGLRTGLGLIILRAEFDSRLTLRDAHLGQNFEFQGGSLPAIDLSGAVVEGEIILHPDKWTSDAECFFRNATAHSILVDFALWPKHFDFRSFRYSAIYALDTRDESHRTFTPTGTDLTIWLESTKYAEPYHYLANHLDSIGDASGARQIRYAGLTLERSDAWRDHQWGWWLWRWSTRIFFGDGFLIFQVGFWYAILVFAGYVVIKRWGAIHTVKIGSGIFYSLDMALPVIRLRESHYDVDLKAGVRHYYYAHQIMGYVLAYYLIAGVSGLISN